MRIPFCASCHFELQASSAAVLAESSRARRFGYVESLGFSGCGQRVRGSQSCKVPCHRTESKKANPPKLGEGPCAWGSPSALRCASLQNVRRSGRGPGSPLQLRLCVSQKGSCDDAAIGDCNEWSCQTGGASPDANSTTSLQDMPNRGQKKVNNVAGIFHPRAAACCGDA